MKLKNLLGPKPPNAIVTIPNIITAIGILLLIPYVWYFFNSANRWIMFGALFFSGFSDLADGYLARKLKQKTKIGEIIDPLRGRLLFTAVLIHFTFLNLNAINATKSIFLEAIIVFIFAEIQIVLFDIYWWKYKILEARAHKIRKIRQAGLTFVAGAAILNNYFQDIISKIIGRHYEYNCNDALIIMAGISLFTLFVYIKLYFSLKKRK